MHPQNARTTRYARTHTHTGHWPSGHRRIGMHRESCRICEAQEHVGEACGISYISQICLLHCDCDSPLCSQGVSSPAAQPRGNKCSRYSDQPRAKPPVQSTTGHACTISHILSKSHRRCSLILHPASSAACRTITSCNSATLRLPTRRSAHGASAGRARNHAPNDRPRPCGPPHAEPSVPSGNRPGRDSKRRKQAQLDQAQGSTAAGPARAHGAKGETVPCGQNATRRNAAQTDRKENCTTI